MPLLLAHAESCGGSTGRYINTHNWEHRTCGLDGLRECNITILAAIMQVCGR